MSVIGGLRKHLNNLACTESVRVGLKTVEAGHYTDEEEDSPVYAPQMPICSMSTPYRKINAIKEVPQVYLQVPSLDP